MGLRDKVALVLTALCILFISQAFCMPKTKKNIKGISNFCNAQNRIKQEKTKIENDIQALYRKYNFPEMEFATGLKSDPCFDFRDFQQNTFNEAVNKKNAFQKFKNKNARKIANKARKAHTNLHRKFDSTLETTPQFASPQNFGNCISFPEVEYPITATDIWKPNYWGDFFQTADNIQNNGFEMCKPCKIEKNKFKCNIKNIKIPSKAKSTSPVQNHTNEEVCPITINSQTTKMPYSNNFVMKDSTTVTKPMDEDLPSNATLLPINNESTDNSDLSEQSQLLIENKNNSNNTCDSAEKYICVEQANDALIQEKSAQDSSQSKESDIELDEEFTTDEPEYAFALSTPLPFSTVESWKEAQVIDPYKSLSYPDELDDYFIAVKG